MECPRQTSFWGATDYQERAAVHFRENASRSISRVAARIGSSLERGCGGEKMGGASKAGAIVLLFGAAIGLTVICQPCVEPPISVSVTTAAQDAKHEPKIVLNAAMNGRGVSHGEVRLDFTPTQPRNRPSSDGNWPSVKGYTDGQGVFISTGSQFPPGEYMITALVSKPGCPDGKSVCFLRVPQSGQDRRLSDGPVSAKLSNRRGR